LAGAARHANKVTVMKQCLQSVFSIESGSSSHCTIIDTYDVCLRHTSQQQTDSDIWKPVAAAGVTETSSKLTKPHHFTHSY